MNHEVPASRPGGRHESGCAVTGKQGRPSEGERVNSMPPRLDDEGLRRYLLGLLPEPEAEALEQDSLASPEVLDRVRAVEHDLLDDYAAGRLGAEDVARFESRYLASPRLRDRVTAARALRLAAPAETPTVPARRPVRWWPVLAVAAALVLVVVVPVLRRPARGPEVVTRPSPSAPTSLAESAPLASPLTPSVPAITRVVFAVSPLRLRGQDGPTELRVPKDAGLVALELEGDADGLAGTSLEATLSTVEGRRVWRGQARRVLTPSRPSLVAVAEVPAEALPAGDYLLKLTVPGGEALPSYFIRVRR